MHHEAPYYMVNLPLFCFYLGNKPKALSWAIRRIVKVSSSRHFSSEGIISIMPQACCSWHSSWLQAVGRRCATSGCADTYKHTGCCSLAAGRHETSTAHWRGTTRGSLASSSSGPYASAPKNTTEYSCKTTKPSCTI